MVAIVTGNGLGLVNTSYTVLGQTQGVFGDAAFGSAGARVYINAATGNLVVQSRDAFLAAPGSDLLGLRTYNSRGGFNDDNGDNWITGVVRQALQVTAGTWGAAGSTVALTESDGSVRTFSWVATENRYVSTTGSGFDTYLYATAGSNLASYVNDQQKATFDVTTGRLLTLSSSTLANATLTYDANGNLASVSADATGTGDRIVYQYSGNQLMRLSTVDASGAVLSSTQYAYDSKGRLAQVTVDLTPADGSTADGRSYVTTYTYVSSSDATNGMLQSMTNSDGSSLTFKWSVINGAPMVTQSWGADGQVSTYFYNGPSLRQSGVQLPGGFTFDFWYDTQGRLTQTHPSKGAGQGITNDSVRRYYTYSATGDVVNIADEFNRSTSLWYNANNELAYTSDASGNVVRRVYANHQLVAEIRYTTADPDGSGSLDATNPFTTRYVYNSAGQLRFMVSPEGAVTEYQYSGLLRSAEITYLGGLYNLSGLAYNQALNESQVIAWVGAADKSKTARTDFTYDLHGELQREVSYARTDSTGAGITDGTQHVVNYVYNALGQLLMKTDGSAAPITFTYDGLGRVLTQQQGSRTTTFVYQDGSNGAGGTVGTVTTLTQQDGLVTVRSYDRMGRLISESQGQSGQAMGTTKYSYNALGQLTKTEDPTGVLHWYLYDERGRKVADIDGNGSVIEYRWDVASQPIQTIRYATPLALVAAGAQQNLAWADGPNTPALASVRPPATAQDISTWSLFDKAGRVVKQVDDQGYVTEFRRDGAGRLTATIRYANAIDVVAFSTAFASNSATATANPTPDTARDRVERTFYDLEDRVVGTLDAEGYLTEMRYDPAGRMVSTVRYADVRPVALRSAGTLAQLRPTAASAQDQRTRRVYDALGQQLAEVDAEGYLTEQVFDDRGHVTQRLRYATPLTAAQLTQLDSGAPINNWRPGPTASDRTERWHYNALDQLDEQTNAEGTITRYDYDAAGRLVSTTQAAGTAEVRTLKVRYDAQGRVVAELSARGAALLTQGQTQAQIDAIWAQYSTRYTYDAAGRRTSQVATDGQQTQRTIYFYNEDGQLTHTVNPLGEVQERQYDGLGQLVRTVSYGGRLGATTLNGLNGGLVNGAIRSAIQELLGQRNSAGNAYASAQTLYAYNERGLLRSTTDALGFVTTNSYNAFGEVTGISQQIRLDGAVVLREIDYDRKGQVVTRTEDAGGVRATASLRYDAFGRVIGTTDAGGTATTTVFDRLGRVVQTVDGAGISRRRTYDAFNRVATETDGTGLVTTYRYDLGARLVEITTPEGIKSSITRNRFGETVTSTDGNGAVTQYDYDENGQLRTTLRSMVGTRTVYDSLGRAVQTIDERGVVTELTYDALNRIATRTVDPAGLKLVTRYVYNDTEEGTSVATTSPDGRTTLQVFDLNGQLLRTVVDPDGLKLTTTYRYDGAGHVLVVIDPTGLLTRYEYDNLGRRTSEVADPGGLNLRRTYGYDAVGRLLSSTDAAGATTRYFYDAAGRLMLEVSPVGAVRETRYDVEGRVLQRLTLATALSWDTLSGLGAATTLAQARALLTYSAAKDEVQTTVYDRDGRVRFSVDALGGVVEYRRDNAGSVKQTIAYANPVNLETWLSSPAAPAPSEKDRVTSTLFDPLGRAVMVVDAEGGITAMAYDDAGNQTAVTSYARALTPSQMQALRTAGANWTAATLGSIVTTPAADRTTSYRYDNANRLRYQYDALGYVTETRYDGLKTSVIRYSTTAPVGSVPPIRGEDKIDTSEVDAAGRVWHTVDAAGGETFYVYDAAGRVTAKTEAANTPDATTTAMRYDAAGRLVEQTVAQGTSAAATTRYGYNTTGQRVQEIEARGVALAESDSDWAQAERQRLGFAAKVAQLSASDRQALLQRFTTTHVYDAVGRRVSTLNALLGATTTQYDTFGNAVKVTDPLGNAGFFYFDRLNRVTLQVDPEGFATQTTYWVAGSDKIASVRRYATPVTAALGSEPTLVASPADALTRYEYDRLDRLVSTTDAVGAKETTQFGVNGNRFDRAVTNKVGGTAVYATDKLGQLVSETIQVSLDGKTVVNQYGYDGFGNRTSSVEAVGLPEQRVTAYRYDKLGRLTHRIGQGYTAFDGATQTSVNVIPVEWTRYDALGRVVEQVSRGNLVNNTDVTGGARTLTRFDAAGNKVEQVGVDGAYTRYRYDPAGHVVRESALGTPAVVNGSSWTAPAPNAALDRHTVMVYDALGRLVDKLRENVRYWEADPAANQILAPVSELTTVRLVANEYDAAGNVVKETDGRGASIYHYYDKLGRKVLRIDQEGYAVGWDYNDFQTAASREVKYAGRVPQYARQNDAQSPAALTDPASLRAGLSLTDARITRYELDTLGRVTEKRVLAVQATALDGRGKTVSRTMDAVTTYRLDGLGNVTLQRDLVGLNADGTAEVWNETSFAYDTLGREIRRIAPGFTDYTGRWVTPVMETEYNGLGLVSRVIQRGLDALSEADDRITWYGYNVNGDRVASVDAEGYYTLLELDAMGQVGRETAKLAMLDANGQKLDRVKRYAYDNAGRIITTYDGDATHAQTGEVRRTRYNVFGEITGKSLGDGWQEFADYNTLGKVERSNSESGVVALFLYDRNGNATRKIISGVADVDLRSTSLVAAAANLSTLTHTFSVYDARNQLIKTVEMAADFQKDVASRTAAVSQQLTQLYGALSLEAKGGGAYTGAAADGKPQIPQTVVSSPDGFGPLESGSTGSPSTGVAGIGPSGSAAPLLDVKAGQGAFGMQLNWSGGPLPTVQSTGNAVPASVSFTLPAGLPKIPYEIRKGDGTLYLSSITPGQTINFLAAGGKDTYVIYGTAVSGSPVKLATLTINSTRGQIRAPSNVMLYATTINSYSAQVVNQLALPSDGANGMSILRRNSNGVVDYVQPVYFTDPLAIGGPLLPTLPSVVYLPLTDWPAGDYTLEIRRFGPNGVLLNATTQSVNVSAYGGAPGATISATPVQRVETIAGALRMPAVSGDNSGTVYLRSHNGGSYVAYGYTYGSLSLDSIGMNAADALYDYVIESNGAKYAGVYRGAGTSGTPVLLSLNTAATQDPTLTFTPKLSDIPGAPTAEGMSVSFEVLINGQWQARSFALQSKSFEFKASELASFPGVTVSSTVQSAYAYRYKVYANNRDGSLKRLISSAQGTIGLGASNYVTTADTGAYRGVATLGIPDVAGAITLTLPNQTTLSLAKNDFRRWGSGPVYLNLVDYINPGGDTNVPFTYKGADADVSGSLTIRPTGQVLVTIDPPKFFGTTVMKINVPNAAKLQTLRVTQRGGGEVSVTGSAANGVLSFPLSADQVGKTFDVYFETQGADGKVNYIGKGSYSFDSKGVATYTTGETVYKASVLSLAAGENDIARVRLKPAGGTFGEPKIVPGGAIRQFPLDEYPRGVSYEFEYIIRDSTDTNDLKKGHGSFTLNADGTVTMLSTVSDRTPLGPITFYGPSEPDATRLRLTIQGQVVEIAGRWNGAQMEYVWARPFNGAVVEAQTGYSYVMEILTASGQPARDAVGEVIQPVQGVMTVGAGADEPFRFQQQVQKVNDSAQVRRYQTYNAFGEVAEEYDDTTLNRAKAMVQQYADFKLGQFTLDPTAVRTRYLYNTQGRLVQKVEAETFETLDNGFVRRIRPTTTYGYDLTGRAVSVTDANGHVTGQSFVGSSDQIAVRYNADETSRTTGYDIFLDARKLVGEMKTVVLQDFDKLGNLLTVTRQGITRVQDFSDGEFPGALKVGNVLTERYAYDGLGQRVQRTDAANQTEKTVYDSLGRVVQTVSASGASVQYRYTPVAAGDAADPVLSLGGLNLGGYRRTTVNADGRTLVDELDYFGRTTWHQDLGGRASTYRYGLSGRLMSQTSTGGQGTHGVSPDQNIRFDYTLSGQLRQTVDLTEGTLTQYGYDDAGNRNYEMYARINADGSINTIMQSSNIQYDELNRISRSWDGSKLYDLRYEYDAVGNRRSAISIYWDVTGKATDRTDFWYTYDAMDRFTTTMGALTARGTSATDANGKIVIGADGTAISYDAAGQRISATYQDKIDWKITHSERYTYSSDGYLEDVYVDNAIASRRRVDALGRTLQFKEWLSGAVYQTTTTEYDRDNRVQRQRVTDSKSNNGVTDYYYFVGTTEEALAGGTGALAKTVQLMDASGSKPLTTTYKYEYWDSAQQQAIKSEQSGTGLGQSTFVYDANGHLKSMTDEVDKRDQTYITNAEGLILERKEQRRGATVENFVHRYYYADGRRVGDVGNDGRSDRISYAEQLAKYKLTPEQRREQSKHPKPVTSADFDQNYEPITTTYPTATASKYTVRQGDSLSAIAQSVWGDSAMWYLIADANGLSATDALVQGQVLTIPNKVTNIHNNASTFRPYDAGEAIGRVDPTLPDPPPPPKKGCGVVGMIVMVVVAVVATVITAGAAAAAMGAVASSATTVAGMGAAAMAGGAAGSVVLSAGVGTLAATIGMTATVVASAAVGAAVGSIASQLVGMAMGNVEKFSWKAVGQSALAAGVTAGVGAAMTPAASASGTASSVGQGASSAGASAKVLSTSEMMLRGGLSSATSQLIQGKWSWRELGVSVVSAGVGREAASALGSGDWVRNTLVSGLAQMASSWASSQIMGYNTSQTRARMGQAFATGLAQGMAQQLVDNVKWEAPSLENKDSAAARLAADQMRSGREEAAIEKGVWAERQGPIAGASAVLDGLTYAAAGSNPQMIRTAQSGGHYYLPLLIGKMVGLSDERVAAIAAYSQFPDQVSALDGYTNGVRSIMSDSSYESALIGEFSERAIHALNNRTVAENLAFYHAEIEKYRNDDARVGISMHGLVDSIFHSRDVNGVNITFDAPLGHGAHGSEPDYISEDQTRTAAGQLMRAFETVGGVQLSDDQRAQVMGAVNKAIADARALTNAEVHDFNQLEETYGAGTVGPAPHQTERMELNFRAVVGDLMRPSMNVLTPPEDLPVPFWRGPIDKEGSLSETQRFLNSSKEEAELFVSRGMRAAEDIMRDFASTRPAFEKYKDVDIDKIYDTKVWSLRKIIPGYNPPAPASQTKL